jgi:YebC/PmpR family DNA-binding regulatory protein
MSGHSKWSKIQHKKGKADKARSNLFTKLSRAVTIAAQTGGGDPEMNFSLRLAIDKAKAGNVPKDNIDRAVKRGAGELKDEAAVEEVIYEGYGPDGVPFLVETMTDNKNRTVSEVKHALSKHGGSLGSPGTVQWQFERMGVVRIAGEEAKKIVDKKDEFELAMIDAGASDIDTSEYGIEIRCPMQAFQSVLEAVQTFNVEPDDSGLEWIANEELVLDEAVSKKTEELADALDELDDVQAVYTNEK